MTHHTNTMGIVLMQINFVKTMTSINFCKMFIIAMLNFFYKLIDVIVLTNTKLNNQNCFLKLEYLR